MKLIKQICRKGAIFTSAIILSAFSLNANAFLMAGSLTSFDEIELGGGSIGGSIVTWQNEFHLTNQTNEVWTDFHLNSSGLGYLLQDYVGSGIVQYNFEFESFHGPAASSVDIFGLDIGIGETLSFTLGYGCAGEICSTGFLGWQIMGMPTTDGMIIDDEIGVPEPMPLALIGMGLLGLILSRRNIN